MKAAIFLVSSAALFCAAVQAQYKPMMVVPTAASTHKGHAEDFVRNDRGVEMNRDFTNIIQYGLIEGMFKVKLSGMTDCTEQGMTLIRAAKGMVRKMQTEESTEDDFLNVFQLYLSFATRCNYWSTI